jgi:hypothetical protein
MHVVWNGSQPAKEKVAKGAPMLYSRMDDHGSRFESQHNLMTSTMNLDGGGSVAADTKGNVYVVWHAHPKTGPEDELHRGVYVARSSDEGRSFAPEYKITDEQTGVCACCGLKAFVDRKGNLAVLYRSADERSNRNSVLLISKDDGRSFESRMLGAWRSPTCPMSTPSLGQGPGNTLAAFWETQGQIYRSFLEPDRLPSSPSAISADGNPGERKHPAFALGGKSGSRLIMAWTEGTGWAKGGALAWECVELGTGEKGSGRQSGVPVWGLPTAVPERDGSFTVIY